MAGILEGLASVAGIASGLAGLFGGGSKAPKVGGAPFKKQILTPAYKFGGGTLARRLPDEPTIKQFNLHNLIGGLRSATAPGFSELRAAQSAIIQSARQKAVGDVSAEFSKRRVLGASFAQQAISNVADTFAEQERLASAETFKQEFDAQVKLIEVDSLLLLQQIKRELDELGIATEFLSTVNQTIEKQAKTQAEIAAMKLSDRRQAGTSGIAA